MPKTDKELAVEAAIELTKSWNATGKVTISPDDFAKLLAKTYEAISKLGK